MNKLRRAFTVLGAVAGLFAVAPVPASALPGEIPSIQVLSSQERSERAFLAGDYDRAHWHFLNVLAPAGDKYGQYMLGYLYEHGLGVRRDPARALAWYALSAERQSDVLADNYRRLAGTVTPDELRRAAAILDQLEARYGDRRLLARAIELDERDLRRKTGTRTGGYGGPLTTILPSGRSINGDRYYEMVERRIQFRTELLGGTVTLKDLELVDEPAGQVADGENGEPEGR